MNAILLILLALFLVTATSGQTNQQTPQKQAAITTRSRTIEDIDNSLEVIKIVKDEVWYFGVGQGQGKRVLHRVSQNQTSHQVYSLPAFPIPSNPIPRWKIVGDYIYTTSHHPFPPAREGHTIHKVLLSELRTPPTEEEIKRTGGLISGPRIQILSLRPLNDTFTWNTVTGAPRYTEPVWYDFLIDKDEKCILLIIADEHLMIWELDSRNNWYHMSLEDDEKNQRAGAKAEWRRVAYVPAPFSTRFHADLNDGRLTLITETSDVWFAAQGQYGFQKKEATAAAENDSDTILIEDTDNHEIWLAPISSGAYQPPNPRLLSGTGKSNERARKALQAVRSVAGLAALPQK